MCAAALLLLAGVAWGRQESTWVRYENSHFVAYSNAPERRALDVLVELEYVRAAAEQIPSFFIPDGKPKSLVLLPATEKEFARLVPFDTMAGFAQTLDGTALIVMPATSRRADAGVVARHEFAHTMLFNDWFRYPQWYAEGFSEVVSQVTVDRRRNTFTVGKKPKRYGRRFRPAIDWDQLIDHRLDAHALGDDQLIQSAYAQSWLLFHFLTLNGETDFASELDNYFALANNGQPAAMAFRQAFGMSAGEMWDTSLRDYARKPTTISREFDSARLDIDFTREVADRVSIDPLLRYLVDKAEARRPGQATSDLVSTLPGDWDQLKFDGQCSERLTFRLRPSRNVIEIDGFYSALGDDPVPGLFSYEPLDDGSWSLVNITDTEYPNVIMTSNFRLTIRNENVFCFDDEAASRPCSTIFHRCGQRD